MYSYMIAMVGIIDVYTSTVTSSILSGGFKQYLLTLYQGVNFDIMLLEKLNIRTYMLIYFY